MTLSSVVVKKRDDNIIERLTGEFCIQSHRKFLEGHFNNVDYLRIPYYLKFLVTKT